MPQLDVTTKQAEQVWQSPDGQRKIYKLVLDYDGKSVMAQTFSDAIATVGWQGTVDTYQRPGKGDRPAETFVKQPPKEDGGGYTLGNRTATPGSRSSGYQAKDEKAIQAMWSIGQAVQLYASAGAATKDEPVEYVEFMAQELFAMVARVKASEDAPEAPDESIAGKPMPADFGVKPDEVVTEVPDGPLDLSDLGEMLGDVEKVDPKETPWNKS